MGWFEFPHTRTYDSDLGWIIANMKTNIDAIKWLQRYAETHQPEYEALKEKVDALVNGLVDVIEPWDSSVEYPIYSIVSYLDKNYIAIRPVPVGAMITNEYYWQEANTVVEQINAIGHTVAELKEEQTFVLPEQFGAKGDGTTDDSAAIIEALSASRGVYLKNKYFCASQIVVPDGAIITGPGTIILDFESVRPDGALQLGNNCVLENITVSGIDAKENNSGYALICAREKKNVCITNCNVVNSRNTNAIALDACDTVQVIGCRIDKYYYAAIICMEGTSNVKICRNTITGDYARTNNVELCYPISISSSYTATGDFTAEHVLVDSNTILADHAYWEGIDSHGTRDCKIVNNTIKGTCTGIAFFTNARTVSEHVEITNNYIELGTANPSTLAGVIRQNSGILCRATGAVIANNEIRNNGEIAKELTSTATQLIALSAGISILGIDNIVTGNIIKGRGGIDLTQSQTAYSSNIRVSNNSLEVGETTEGTSVLIFARNTLKNQGNIFIENNYMIGSAAAVRYLWNDSDEDQRVTLGIFRNNIHNGTVLVGNYLNIIPDVVKWNKANARIYLRACGVEGFMVTCTDGRMYCSTPATESTYAQFTDMS